MIIGMLLAGLILFGISYIVVALLRDNRKEDEYEYMTIQDCKDLYYYVDKRVVIEDGKITDIVNR